MVDRSAAGLQRQIDDLVAVAATDRAMIEALTRRADASELRADEMEARSGVDREMIAELRADGVLSREHVGQLEEALVSSRTIGAALGILMASRHIGQEEALLVLKGASQRTNTRLREVAETIVKGAEAAS